MLGFCHRGLRHNRSTRMGADAADPQYWMGWLQYDHSHGQHMFSLPAGEYWLAQKALTTFGAGLITAEVIVGGLGRHSYYLQPHQIRLFIAMGWADWVQTFITLMFTKISICLFLLRIVDGRKIRLAMYSLIGCLILFTTVFVGLFLGICRPLRAHWDTGVEGVCLSEKVIENIIIAQGGMWGVFVGQLTQITDICRQCSRSSPISSAPPSRSSSWEACRSSYERK